MSVRVWRGDGCGNRFLLLRRDDLERTGLDAQDLAPRACGREHDGMLVVDEEDGDGVRTVRIVNRDGSDGGACLNGLRVVARWTGEDAGVLRMAGRRVPWALRGAQVELRLPVDAGALSVERFDLAGREAWHVAFWNPHAVCFVAADEALETVDLEALAAAAAADRARFPDGVNVEIARREESRDAGDVLHARVHERGVGETRACGSGAVALAAAAWGNGSRGPVAVRTTGGTLHLEDHGEGVLALSGAARCQRPDTLEVILEGVHKPL